MENQIQILGLIIMFLLIVFYWIRKGEKQKKTKFISVFINSNLSLNISRYYQFNYLINHYQYNNLSKIIPIPCTRK